LFRLALCLTGPSFGADLGTLLGTPMAEASGFELLDSRLRDLNADLKMASSKVRVERQRKRLYLRATLPHRQEIGVLKQQRIQLSLQASAQNVGAAYELAQKLNLELKYETFTWSSWGVADTESTPTELELTVEDFHRAAKQLHAAKYRRKPPENAEAIWGKKWRPALNKIPPSGAITEDVLLRMIRKMPPESAAQRDQGNVITPSSTSC